MHLASEGTVNGESISPDLTAKGVKILHIGLYGLVGFTVLSQSWPVFVGWRLKRLPKVVTSTVYNSQTLSLWVKKTQTPKCFEGDSLLLVSLDSHVHQMPVKKVLLFLKAIG